MPKIKKQTYMIAIQETVILKPTVYQEVIAKSAQDAIQIVKKQLKKQADGWCAVSFRDEIKECLNEIDYDKLGVQKTTKFISAGRASQYHSEEECELCASIQPKNRTKK